MNYPYLCILSVIAASLWSSTAGATDLTFDQQSQILQEASTAYDRGLQIADTDVAATKDAFSEAATKYRLLIDSGIENAKLYENLGNAALQGGQYGASIAAYEHAAVLAPSDSNIRNHLKHARSLRDAGTNTTIETSLQEELATWNQWVPRQWRFTIGISAWVLLWGCLTWGLILKRRNLTRIAMASAVVALMATASIGWEWSLTPHQEFGIVTSPATLRTHNGDNFEAVIESPLSEGTRFDVIERRGSWLQVRLSHGAEGWIPLNSADVISPQAMLQSS